jgi:hypothetical protein
VGLRFRGVASALAAAGVFGEFLRSMRILKRTGRHDACSRSERSTYESMGIGKMFDFFRGSDGPPPEAYSRVTNPERDDGARWVGGSKGAFLPTATSLRAVNVNLMTGPGSEFVIDAGRDGALRIPYASMSYVRYAANECGMGTPQELKGAANVFVDTSGSREWVDGESYDRIASALAKAQLGLKLVSRVEDAEIVLAFRYAAGTKPQWLRGTYDIGDTAVGEVYVASSDGLRVVMTFDEELSLLRTGLATRFAEAFIEACRRATP